MFSENDHILVTGGAGFIGSHLVEQLVATGAHVTVVDNLLTGSLENLQAVLSRVKLLVGDMGDLLRLEQIKVDGFDYVFHLAANAYIPPSVENPFFDFQMNLYNPILLLEALRRAKRAPRLVNISSAAVYGNPVRLPIRETDPTVPISPYGVSKLSIERYVAVYSQLYGLRATSLRFFSVYGPRQSKQVVYDLIRKLYANPKQLEVLGNGSQARDFTHVLDVVQAMFLAATKAPSQGEVYNVASGTTCTIAELVAKLSQLCHLTPRVAYTGHVRPGDAEKWEVDITRLKSLGFEAHVSLEAGLSSVLDWYKQQPALNQKHVR
jgi:UDP-glucose 4-epimerase